MNERPMTIDRFTLRPGMNRGDSVLLLDEARHGAAFDSFPGRYGVIAALASAETPAALDALQALEDSRRIVDSGKASFFAAIPGLSASTLSCVPARRHKTPRPATTYQISSTVVCALK